jgi:hypothetical protein
MRHDCLPSLLGYVDKSIEKVALKNIEKVRKDKNLLYQQDPCQMYFLTLESPFQNPLRPSIQPYKAKVTFSIRANFYICGGGR